MLDLIIPTPPDGARLALDLVGLRQEIDKLELRFSQTAATGLRTWAGQLQRWTGARSDSPISR